MKKISFAAFAVVLCYCISCNTATPVGSESKDSQVQKNLDATHVVNKAFETGDVSGLDSVIADDFLDHTDRGDVRGRDSLKAMVNMVRTHNKDMKMDVIKELADNDYVFSLMRFEGNHDGSMMAAGHYDMKAIQVVKFNNNGKAAEHWEFMEPAEMMKMMGKMQGMEKKMGNQSKKDSANKKSK